MNSIADTITGKMSIQGCENEDIASFNQKIDIFNDLHSCRLESIRRYNKEIEKFNDIIDSRNENIKQINSFSCQLRELHHQIESVNSSLKSTSIEEIQSAKIQPIPEWPIRDYELIPFIKAIKGEVIETFKIPFIPTTSSYANVTSSSK